MSVPVNIPEAYKHLETPIKELRPLPGNPRKGATEAIIASYTQYGQTKPIVVYEDEDGEKTVVAGNHQLMAAKEMGWDRIAAIVLPWDEKNAVGYALADNRVSELGSTDNDLLFDMLSDVIEDIPELFEALEWDDFELAAIAPTDTEMPEFPASQGWQPPELVSRDKDDEMHWDGDKDSTKELVASGSTSAGVSGSKNAIVQYTLVFDSPQQQSAWYAFLRWVKPRTHRYPGETTAAQLVSFIEAHTKEPDDES